MTDRTDCSGLSNIMTAKQKKEEERVKIVNSDIEVINSAISSDDEKQMRSAHMLIDGKYSTCIPNLGKSMYCYSDQLGFEYEYLEKESLKHNLTMMRSKLQGYICDFPISADSSALQNNISVNVPVVNEINITITFEQAKQKIEEMPGLTDADTDEIKSKIDDLEKISNEKIPRKKKWEKVKPILIFALDKGVDVAITIMSLILQMKLGI